MVGEDLFPEEEGVPGHGSRHSWAKRLHSRLRELGVAFEAEAEATRIHVGDLVVEVAEAGENGYQVVLTIPLPAGSGEDPEYYAGVMREAARLVSLLGGGVEYSLDTSLPDYPTLYASKKYGEPDRLVEELVAALEKIAGEKRSGVD